MRGDLHSVLKSGRNGDCLDESEINWEEIGFSLSRKSESLLGCVEEQPKKRLKEIREIGKVLVETEQRDSLMVLEARKVAVDILPMTERQALNVVLTCCGFTRSLCFLY